MATIASDIADLVLGRRCLGCARPGPGLCGPCLSALRSSGPILTVSDAQPPAVAAAAYDGLVRRALLAFKEEGYRALASGLGLLLADAVTCAAQLAGPAPVVLVPVPGHRRSGRGFDPVGMLTRVASRELAAPGAPVPVLGALATRRRYPALKDLGRDERRAAVAGAFAVRRELPRGLALIVVDDIRTTGATTEQAAHTLRAAGARVVAVATVAASPGRQGTCRAPARPTRPS